MTFPIVTRELRVAVRRPGTYWLRCAAAAFAVLACLQWFNPQLVGVTAPAVGPAAFRLLSLLGLIVALGLPVLSADCISHERREGTLGLLFLTTLKSHDVVFGKFAVIGSAAFYALLGFTPVMLLPLTSGGVTPGEVVRMALLLANSLFLSISVALFISVRARSQAGATIGAVGAIFGLTLIPFGGSELLSNWLPLPVAIFSPLSGYYGALDVFYSVRPGGFWTTLALNHLTAWLLLALAVFTLRHNWRLAFAAKTVKPRRAGPRRLIAPARVVLFSRTNRRRAFAPVARAVLRMGGQRPMAWLAALFSVSGSVAYAVASNVFGSAWAAASASLVFNLASTALFAFVAGRFFFESRRSGELELLLVTPVGARGILREQRLALLRLILGPLYLVLFGCIVATPFATNFDDPLALLLLATNVCRGAGIVLGVLAAIRVGMWFGTRTNSLLALAGWTVGLVEVAPVAIAFLVPLLFVSFSATLLFWGAMPLLMLAKNFAFIFWAGRKLRHEFRAPDRSLLDRLFGWFAAGTSARLSPENR